MSACGRDSIACCLRRASALKLVGAGNINDGVRFARQLGTEYVQVIQHMLEYAQGSVTNMFVLFIIM